MCGRAQLWARLFCRKLLRCRESNSAVTSSAVPASSPTAVTCTSEVAAIFKAEACDDKRSYFQIFCPVDGHGSQVHQLVGDGGGKGNRPRPAGSGVFHIRPRLVVLPAILCSCNPAPGPAALRGCAFLRRVSGGIRPQPAASSPHRFMQLGTEQHREEKAHQMEPLSTQRDTSKG